MDRIPGERLGPYELVRRLGRGGAGEVWEAVLHGPGGFEKPVALKILASAPDPAVRHALFHEARLGGLLQHPNVVGTLGVSEHEGTCLVALELVRGASTAELVAVTGPLSARAVIEVGVQACAGLAYVHELVADGAPSGLVHRDVKPSNVLVDRTGFVRLADLGVTLAAGESRRPAGTPGYMAPEQAENRAEPRSDLFSLGATLFTLATARLPFGTRHADAARVEELLGASGFLAPVDEAVPGLAAVVARCLRGAPADRYGSARELGAVLVALRSHHPGGASLSQLVAEVRPEPRDEAGDTTEPAPPAGNLPPPRDTFVGRQDEVRSLRDAVLGRSPPILVLLGPGGVGKTTLALEVARAAQEALSGGAWLFDLWDARSADAVAAAVAGALGVEPDRDDPVAHVGRMLASKRRALFVFDHADACAPHLAATVGRWAHGAPEASFLCASRRSTGLALARNVWVDGLPPADAAALFLARATRPVRPDEHVDVEAVCDAVERIPLAIELAAARVRTIGVGAIRARMSLAMLSGGRRDAPERHRSLEASLDASFEHLSGPARDALATLAVFEGGFGLEAAREVLAGSVGPLQELNDSSLLRVGPQADRFALPAVVREYATLRAPAAVRAGAEQRHGAFYARLAAPVPLDLEDLLAACRRAVARGDGPTAVPTLCAAWSVLAPEGPSPAAAALADEVAAMPSLGPRERALAEGTAGAARRERGA